MAARASAGERIHWHTSRRQRIEYVATDDKRQVIASVRLTDAKGRVKEWIAPDVTAEALAKGEHRQMDCMDCHNRPSHQFAATPERAVDQAIANGELERNPAVHPPRGGAGRQADLSHPRRRIRWDREQPDDVLCHVDHADASGSSAVDRAIAAVQRVYGRNVFPTMKVTWGTYANNLGHLDFPGASGATTTITRRKDGTTISQDCELCHKIDS